jgi:hypothetical protein
MVDGCFEVMDAKKPLLLVRVICSPGDPCSECRLPSNRWIDPVLINIGLTLLEDRMLWKKSNFSCAVSPIALYRIYTKAHFDPSDI